MKWSVCLLVVCLSATFLPAVHTLSRGEPCHTPTGTPGTCELVRECEYARKLQSLPDFSSYDIEYLRSLKCGQLKLGLRKPTKPLVCCPKFGNSVSCGAQTMGGRITYGEETELGEYPWAGLLYFDAGRHKLVPKCGGALVTERYVITAAHCTADPIWKLEFVRFNEFNKSSTDNCTIRDDREICRMDFGVETITPHPEYGRSESSAPNDICILRLAADVSFDADLRPICLPLEPDVRRLPIVGETFTVTGWGETEHRRRASDIQLHVDIPGLENEACNSVYAVANVTLTHKQLCVGGLNRMDSCRGDSGGPLMRSVGGAWYLVGVVSFGATKCGTRHLPGVYTNVVQYLDWLEMVMFVQHYL
uniref:CLIP domain-containing serine protease n=1 Tax=Anopheles farauti TaxID=69004 RepID=A0A182QVE9_9DIPT